MKPLRIEMQAFGPFAGRQTVDFSELGDKTFFLVHGPTGSGKTSILDGICFALFGDSSGGEREGRQMRSHHADERTLTEVRFDFALGPDRYRVRRVPEQMRKALRGGGETKQAQIAELWALDSTGGTEIEKPLAAGWGKVTERMVRLLGFESAQFRQVIVLPQGKFQEFLKSSSAEREKILQALFGTEIYKRIEEALKAAALELSRETETLRTQRKTLLDHGAAADEAALEARRQQQAADLASRQAAEQAGTAAAQAAERALAEARRVADRYAELDQAASALAALQAETTAWADRRAQLAAGQAAATLRPFDLALMELGRQLAAEAATEKKLAADLVTATAARDQAEAALARERARAPEADAAIARSAELAALVDKVAALATTRTTHAAALRAEREAAAALTRAQQALTAASASRQTLATQVQDRRVQAAGLAGLRETQARLAAQAQQASQLAQLTREQVEATRLSAQRGAALQQAETALATARQQREATQTAWVAGQAARLAQRLIEGQPCPVCGAHDHPAPAHGGEPLVEDSTLQAADEALARAEAARLSAERAWAAQRQAGSVLAARMADLTQALGDAAAAPDELAAQLRAAHAELTVAETAAAALPQLEADAAAALATEQSADTALKTAEAAAAQAQTAARELAVQLTEREAGIPADLADPKALQAARAAADRQREALKQALNAAAQAASAAAIALAETAARRDASARAREALAATQSLKQAEFERLVQAAGFESIEASRAARLDEAALAALDTRIRAFDSALAAATARHARATADTADLARPDLAARLAEDVAAKEALRAAANAVRDTQSALAETARLAGKLAQLAGRYAALETRWTLHKRIADLAGGANPQRMSFQRYVLATLLEEVLAAASLRLRTMSRGRYELRRKQAPADQRAAAGLDLEVFDQYTGTTRVVATLSGGESFLASLALALGLSDVVQAHAGGIRLDAIFVDEGFGSLDPEALDHAIATLKGLQQSGRLVGIVSHVAELKEWIDARLELKATQNGSVARFAV